MSGLDFLNNISKGIQPYPGDNVVVIGGGNVAIDAAVSAIRLGSKNVTIVYRRTKEEMPAHLSELNQALEEGVKLMPSMIPGKVIAEDGIITGLEVMKSISTGHRQDALFVDSSSNMAIPADCVITAVGQKINAELFEGTLTANKNNMIIVEEDSCATNIEGVYAAGDVVTGPATVVEAIAGSRKAVQAMNNYLMKTDQLNLHENTMRGENLTFDRSCLQKSAAAKESINSPENRKLEAEDTAGITQKELESEAKRCFNCGCVASSPSDLAVALIALNARIATSQRIIDANDFFAAGIKQSTILHNDEVVLSIKINKEDAFNFQKYLKFRARKTIDFPVAAVAVNLKHEKGKILNARIVLGAVKPVPFRAVESEKILIGNVADDRIAGEAAEIAVKSAMPLAENKYKINIITALIKRRSSQFRASGVLTCINKNVTLNLIRNSVLMNRTEANLLYERSDQ